MGKCWEANGNGSYKPLIKGVEGIFRSKCLTTIIGPSGKFRREEKERKRFRENNITEFPFRASEWKQSPN